MLQSSLELELDDALEQCRQSPITVWADGKGRGVPPPWLCYINLSNRCNSRCYFCGHGTAMRDDKGFMTFDLFRQIVDSLPDTVRKVYLIKQGEPFAHKQLEDCVEYLADHRPDIHICLHTNAIIARRPRMELVLPRLNSMGISISATDAETYKAVHCVDKFDLVLRNMEDVDQILASMPVADRPHVFIDYVLAARNAHEDRDEAERFFRSRFPNIASVDFHTMYNYQGEIEEGNLEVYRKVETQYFPTCVFPWSSITFLYDGKIGYCFVEPRETRFLGDITQQSFEEIWNGAEYETFRTRMAEKRFDELAADDFFCHQCSWLWRPGSMAPRNLSYGYATQLNERNHNPHFGDVLQEAPIHLLRRGCHYYLAGEIHQALACFSVLRSTNHVAEVIAAADQGIALCQKVMAKYSNLSVWYEGLAEEGVDRPDLGVEYRKASKDDV